MDVFESTDISDEQLMGLITPKIANKEKIVFTCKTMCHDIQGAIVLPCLQRLDSAWLRLIGLQSDMPVALIHGKCEACYTQDIKGILEHRVEKVNADFHSIMSQIVISSETTSSPHIEEKINGISRQGHLRRRLLFNLIGKGAEESKQNILTTHAPLGVAQTQNFVDTSFKKYQRSMRIAQQLIQKNVPIQRVIGLMPYIDAKQCQACSICINVCPHNALHVSWAEPLTIAFNAIKCIECHLCEDVCFADAIVLREKTLEDIHNGIITLFREEKILPKDQEQKIVIFRT
jgi:formate hydrogenlyase subunit 6/NADH:ubiquinone oxidoreductase subunit I